MCAMLVGNVQMDEARPGSRHLRDVFVGYAEASGVNLEADLLKILQLEERSCEGPEVERVGTMERSVQTVIVDGDTNSREGEGE